MASEIHVRKDIEKLSTAEMDLLIRAFHYICVELPVTDENSFFQIAGYHGMPFRGPGWANLGWWGGYCNHGNILFPTWHRAYLLRLEEALRSAPDCASVTMPYWNELKMEMKHDANSPTGEKLTFTGVPPPIFFEESYSYTNEDGSKGDSIPNPLFSYKLQKSIVDNTSKLIDIGNYSKHIGYQTVRYPFSGLVGEGAAPKTAIHNEQMRLKGKIATDEDLRTNILTWLNAEEYTNSEGKKKPAGVGQCFLSCLDAPNYTVFSNNTSAKAWNDDHMDEHKHKNVVSLENPHNKVHLAVGGFQLPGGKSYSYIEGANGDMGENDTASFDPIFFFHHCFIDLMFWRWQEKKGATKTLHIEVPEDYPGTNSIDEQGPTPGVLAGARLTLDSPLEPFKKTVTDPGTKKTTIVPKTSVDVTDITALGYKYDFDNAVEGEPVNKKAEPILSVSGVNRGDIKGSFVITTWAEVDGKEVLVDADAHLSRWNVGGCANCQTHLEVGSHVSLSGFTAEEAKKTTFFNMIHTRDNLKGERLTLPVRIGSNADAARH
ncbi:hypothetical protein B0T24DRAFT_707646 [Lasiosphaeria ovina]|uniref:tyrosinase n=1 Tax=Lasiosphaeria ovina TaxID=92902 RepID=A0AAE0K4E2_9PEZI|nr:hypothetical protein B0T24DRAFT_707646 [Lasiosphaeria ovina]